MVNTKPDGSPSMVATSSAQLVSKMLNYQKNLHAEAVARTLARVQPGFLAMFKLHELMGQEGMRSSVLQMLKVYIEKRE
jgi:hypothetical protein